MRVDRTLGLPGGARGVDDEGVVARLQVAVGAGLRALGLHGQTVDAQHGDARTERGHRCPGPSTAGRAPARRRRTTWATSGIGPTGSRARGRRRRAAPRGGPRRTRASRGPATGPGRPGRRRARRGRRPSARCAGRGLRRRRPVAPPPVDQHGRAGSGRPQPLPHLGQGPSGRQGVPRRASAPGTPAPSPPATAGHSLAVMTARRIAIVPHTHWDREWYKSYQDFRLALVELHRHAAPPARAGRQLPPLHARRPDGRGRRLPRGTARGRGAAAGAGRRRPAEHGPVVHPHGRVPRLGRDHRAQPADGPGARRRVRGRHGRRLPARHVRPHRADAPDPPSRRLQRRRRVARACRHR